jgi:hypothetical protein
MKDPSPSPTPVPLSAFAGFRFPPDVIVLAMRAKAHPPDASALRLVAGPDLKHHPRHT